MQQHLARLHTELSITAEQEPQWSAFADAVVKQTEHMRTLYGQARQMPASAPDRIDRQLELMRQRLAGFETVGQAAKTLYASLSSDQQRVADQRLMRFGHRDVN
jgi:hypothetical protein